MKIYDKNTLKNTIAFTVIGFLMVPLIVWAIDTVATGFRATATEKKIDIVASSEPGHSANDCYYVRSKTSSDYFVPTKTSSEWSAFKSNHSTSQMEKWKCSIPENSCRIGYDYLIDGDDAPVRYTPYTNNTTTYQTGTYSIDKTGKDKHCDADHCGIRASVQCLNNDYAIRVGYQYRIGTTSSSTFYTPWSDISTAFGGWAKVFDNSQTECDTGCSMRMFVETRGDDALVNCSISYKHRADAGESAWQADGTWSVLTYNTSDDEDCENAGCGMIARIYCDGPGGGNGSSSSTSSGGGTGQSGTCGPANGQFYSSAPPSSDLCNTGTVNGYQFTGDQRERWCGTPFYSGADYCVAAYIGSSSSTSGSSSSIQSFE